MNDERDAKKWADEQNEQDREDLWQRGNVARKNGQWQNWSHWAKQMWNACDERDTTETERQN